MVNSCKGMLRLCGLVASEGKRSIDSVCNDSGNVQCGSRLSRMIHWILGIGWGGDGVPEEIGTSLVNNKCSPSPFLARRWFVQRP